jgi:hypothetical protein
MAAIVYILFVISTGNVPDFTALAVFQSEAACRDAAKQINSALSPGQYAKTALCLTSDSLNELADKNKVSEQVK